MNGISGPGHAIRSSLWMLQHSCRAVVASGVLYQVLVMQYELVSGCNGFPAVLTWQMVCQIQVTHYDPVSGC
jgi:hypothetical protein